MSNILLTTVFFLQYLLLKRIACRLHVIVFLIKADELSRFAQLDHNIILLTGTSRYTQGFWDLPATYYYYYYYYTY